MNASNAELAFVIGLVATLWAASGYVGAFGRGMNRVYGVKEGRPFWEMRPAMLAVSAALVVLGRDRRRPHRRDGSGRRGRRARVLGLDEGVVFWWDLGKLPVLAAIGIVVLALLYWAAPNVKRRHLRWFSVGAVVALLAWLATTALFGALRAGVRHATSAPTACSAG